MKIPALLRSLALLPLFANASIAVAQSSYDYTLTQLGAFNPQAMNQAGTMVVGNYWDNQTNLIEYSYGWELNVRSFASAFGVNDAGTVVGYALTGGAMPLLITSDGVQTVLNPFNQDPATSVAGATGINNSGLVAGYGYTQADGYKHAFTYDSILGTVTDLGTLGGNYSVANAVNDSGQVTGQARTADGYDHVYLYQAGVLPLTDLGTLPGGHFSDGLAISSNGMVAGYSDTANGGNNHAFVYSNLVGMLDLGVLDGVASQATGVNAAGQVVGDLYYPVGAQHGFFYDGGRMVDLNTMFPSSPLAPYVQIQDALAINDKGWILAMGYNTQDHLIEGFLLTPQPVMPSNASGLQVTSGNGNVSLHWAASTDAGGAPIQYTVYQGTSAGGEYLPVYIGTNTSATVTGLNNGTMYYFVVQAASIGGISAKSNEVSATPQSAPAPAVSIHDKPAVITLGTSSTLTWASQNATSCTASGAWSGRVALRGARAVAPTAKGAYTYTLTCTGAGGSTSASALLHVH